MNIKLRGGISVLALLLTLSFQAQVNEALEKAKQLYTQKEYSKAAAILHTYLQKDPKDVYVNWLYGQIAHERGYNDLSRMLFGRALEYAPENRELKINYARSLFYSRQLKKAYKEFKELATGGENDATQMESYLMLAYIDFWGQKYQSSENYINKILEKNPEDQLANQLKQNIQYITTPYIKIDLDYTGDNQTLNSFSENIEVGISKNEYLNPKLFINNQNFDTHKQVLTMKAGNTFLFDGTGFSLYISAGGYKHFSHDLGWVGEAELQKKVGEYMIVKAGVNRQPYLYTLRSTYKQVFENNAYGNIEYDNPKWLSVKALYQHKFFKDNYIDILGGWALSKYFKFNWIEFRGGYGFSYSDSKDVLYYPEEESAIDDFLWEKVSGIYDPYFTPKKQVIHSLLGTIKLNITSKISMDISGTYAFYAKNDSPIVFSGRDPEGNYIYERYYYEDKNHPFDIKAFLHYLLSDKISLGAYYQYQENSFYNQNKAGATFFYKF